METKQTHRPDLHSGFALLMTLIVVSVVISIGLSVLDLTIKQVRLSTNSRDSETSFHAATAGVECARFWRRDQADEMEVGDSISPTCFGTTPVSGSNAVVQLPTADLVGDGEVFKYSYNFSWGGADPRCTQIVTMVASATAMVNPTTLGDGVTTTNMTSHISGYPSADNEWYCGAGERCTVLSVRGYNRACAASYGNGTVEREVLLQF